MGTNHNGPSNVYCVSRNMFDHPVVGAGNCGKDPWSAMEAWQYLIASAQYKASELEIRGEIVTIGRGQSLTTISTLAKRWMWSEKQVRGFLDKICRHNLAIRKTGTPKGSRPTVLTLCNYAIYQFGERQSGQPKRQPKGSPRAAQGQHTIKMNKVNKENTHTEGELFDEEQQAFDAYNEVAKLRGLAVARALTPDRRTGLKASIKDHGLAGWLEAMANLKVCAWLCGQNDKKFRADLDWLLENPPKFRRLLEGGYSNGIHASVPNNSAAGVAIPDHVRSYDPNRKPRLTLVSS